MATRRQLIWSKCHAFVGKVCADRDPTHGLQHMEEVTTIALSLASLDEVEESRSATTIERIILIGMLHDVNDHKYDRDGTLDALVTHFVKDTCAEFFPTVDASIPLQTISAISFSKEKKNGKRWFEAHLPAEWIRVRDLVSDADKMTAIGKDGLERCWHYNTERIGHEAAMRTKPSEMLKEVRDHAEEKLLRLTDEYIVTAAGKLRAKPLHEEMKVTLALWEQEGVPTALSTMVGGN